MVNKELIPTENFGGTSLMGYIRANYNDLVAVFGEPHFYEPGNNDKVQCEWDFEYNGEVFTIYDWKEYRDPKLVFEWHIGGKTRNVINIVKYFATDKMHVC